MSSKPKLTDNESFYGLETAVLDAIAAQYPAQQDKLRAQFRKARVTGRRNSGAGFFTDIEVDRQQAEPVTLPRVIGNVWADVDSFDQPMTFLVFMQDGFAKMLEGALPGDETTKHADFRQLGCTIKP